MQLIFKRVVLLSAACAFSLVHTEAIFAYETPLRSPTALESQPPSQDEIKYKIIAASIAVYPGNCPCPYNRAKNGSSCGRRSAYSRPGGYSPICYPSDVTEEMISVYRTGKK
jgi:hypothetical protein